MVRCWEDVAVENRGEAMENERGGGNVYNTRVRGSSPPGDDER